MSNVASQPRASRSPSCIDRDVEDQFDHFIPSLPEESYPDHNICLTQPMSDVLKGTSQLTLPSQANLVLIAADQFIVQTEQYSADLGTYSHAFSPPTLDHSFQTPEYSSEHQFSDPSIPNTPSWEDSWFPSGAPVELDETETLTIHASNDSNHLAINGALYDTIQGRELKVVSTLLPSEIPRQLMSPQLTNTPSPSGQHSQNGIMGPTSVPVGATPHSNPEENKARSRSLRVNPHHTPATSGSSSLQASPSDAFIPAPSPILMVSTYNRGDSPARSAIPMARSSSKRSRTSQSSAFLTPANHYSDDEDDDGLHQGPSQSALSHVSRAKDGSWLPDSTSGQTGLDPTTRGDQYVPSLKEIEEKRQIDEKNAEVASWLEKSEAGSELGEELEVGPQPRSTRLARPRARAHSTGARPGNPRLSAPDDSGLPGPGVVLDEDSDGAYTEDSASWSLADDAPESPPADVDVHLSDDQSLFPAIEETTPEQEEPLPRQFIRAQPWQDVVRGPILHDPVYQPKTSNAAMYKYDLLATKFETASRAATWGTRRRLSETDVQSILSGQSVRKLSLAQKTRERGNSFVKQASRFIPRRSSSNAKKKDAEPSRDNSSTESLQKKRTDTLSSFKSLQRIPSIGKAPKTPPVNTGGALLAMTGQLTAVGRSTSANPDTGGFLQGPWQALNRHRSKSEIPRTKSSDTPGLAQLMTNHGGPPMPTLASPMQEKASVEKHPMVHADDDHEIDEDEDEAEPITEQGVRIDLKVKMDNIVPNFEGFRTHATQLNPRLQPFLADRIVHEQVRRYKKLVENKVKHTHAVKNLKECPSRSFCFDLGGEAKDLPPRMSTKDPEASGAQFQVSGNGDSDGEANTFAEGVVTAALFPAGIPLPPVKRLPAEFECSLCFKVKKFQKPSDWTKHVHEDVQPFTCTFADCSDTRSFKRKADWVRHENERHRHLEWWKCNMPECNHICYRKDNFVQHLVREHKKREPKVKLRGSASSRAKPVADPMAAWQTRVEEEEISELWRLVEMCHVETQKKPKDEVCKFCGNVCTSWKKLTVHLAKHMEQIAMPVLELVKSRVVSPDTIISPIERSNRQHRVPNPASPQGNMKAEPNSVSPYLMNVTPQHTGLQATTSPSAYSQDSHYTTSMQNSPNFPHTPTSTYDPRVAMQPQDMTQFAQMHNLPANMSYGPYQNARQPPSFTPINTTGSATSTYPPFNSVRRSPQQMIPDGPQSHPGFGQIDTMYNSQPPQQAVFSSPTEAGPYAAQFDVSMDQMPHYTTSTMAYHPSGLSTGTPLPPNLIYDPQQEPPFLANQSNDQSYPYTPH